MKRSWNRFVAADSTSAIRGCLGYARDHRNLSVEGVADLAGFSHHDLYKYASNGRMPAILIPPFEHACGAHFLSDWLALKAGRLVISVPLGRSTSAKDINALQTVLNDAVGQILAFAAGNTDEHQALSAIHAAMAGLAWHRVNIEKHSQPELALGADE
ncbi:hypothetical protein R0381_003622 [Jeongeupia wiesaeckerbachi]|uniref:hypothetical protein n=1 Tax=Jeongeupia wiesaeckerbachi TaxID=3051218 RepID=UPI003D809E79